jgi:hypothetical protein
MPIKANAYIYEHFGVQHNNVGSIILEWGARSQYQQAGSGTEIITINETLRGNDTAVQCHMNHEMFHAISGLGHGDNTETYNGVRISDWIEGW